MILAFIYRNQFTVTFYIYLYYGSLPILKLQEFDENHLIFTSGAFSNDKLQNICLISNISFLSPPESNIIYISYLAGQDEYLSICTIGVDYSREVHLL